MRLKELLLIAPLLVLSPVASATLYVTDDITVGLFATPEMQGEPELSISSGTAVEVVEKRGELLKVRTEHGEQGWLRSSSLIKEKPAALQLEELKQDQTQLESTLEKLKDDNEQLKKIAADAKTIPALRGELGKLRKENDSLKAEMASQPKQTAAAQSAVDDQVSALQAKLDAAESEKGDLEQRLAAAVLIGGGTEADFEGNHSPSFMELEMRLPGVIALLIVALLLGGGLSYLWLDRRLTKRFGGIKLH